MQITQWRYYIGTMLAFLYDRSEAYGLLSEAIRERPMRAWKPHNRWLTVWKNDEVVAVIEIVDIFDKAPGSERVDAGIKQRIQEWLDQISDTASAR